MATKADKVIKFFPVPFKGTNRQIPRYKLEDDQLWTTHNIYVRDGEITLRPGFTEYSATTFTGTATGSTTYYKTANTPLVVFGTVSKLYSMSGTTITQRSATDLTGANTNPNRFTSIVLGTPGTSYVLQCNGVDAPRKWDGTAANFSAVAGSPPTFTDWTTLDDKIIGIVPPYLVRWSPTRAIDSWPDLHYHQAAFTPDQVRAISSLGTTNGVLYKDRTIWTITPTGAQSDPSAFRFDLYGYYDGPAGPNAVINAEGLQVRMTANGRIGVFNGSSHSWIGDGIWSQIRDDIDITKAARVFGFYDAFNSIAHFFYPRSGSVMNGWVIITFPKPNAGIPDFGCWFCRINSSANAALISSGVSLLNSDQTYTQIVFSEGASKKTYKLTGTLEADGSNFSGYWETPLVQLPESMRIEGVEVLADRGNGYGNLKVTPTYSYVLGSDGINGQEVTVNLGAINEPVRDLVGIDTRARFLALRFDTSNAATTTLNWKGCAVYGQKTSY